MLVFNENGVSVLVIESGACSTEARESPPRLWISHTGLKEKRLDGATHGIQRGSSPPGPGMTGPCTPPSPAFGTSHSTQGTPGGPLATAN